MKNFQLFSTVKSVEFLGRTLSCFSLFTVLFFPGCTTSQIIDTPAEEKAVSLYPSVRGGPTARRAVVRPRIALELELADGVEGRLGSQYFLFLPLGKTDSGEIAAHSFNTSYSLLNTLGYDVSLKQEQRHRTLQVRVEDVSITTYDLIATRLVKSSIILSINWKHSGREPIYSSAKRSEYMRLPFSSEITQLYRLIFSEALEQGISRLKKTNLDMSRDAP